MYTYIYICIYLSIYLYLCLHLSPDVYYIYCDIYICTHIHVYINSCKNVHIYIYEYICLYVYMYICIYVYTHMYIDQTPSTNFRSEQASVPVVRGLAMADTSAMILRFKRRGVLSLFADATLASSSLQRGYRAR